VSLTAAPDAPLVRPDESPAKPTRLNYRPDIDGIRGTAAIMVMGFHAGVPGFEGSYIGLDLFFVVSGFVITNLLLGEFNKTGRIKWSAFYARRARRLIPAKATMLIGVLLLSLFVLTPTGSQQETAKSAAAAAGFVSNIFFWQNTEVSYFGHAPGTGVLLHTWSLSVEEQFYVAMPFLILIAWLLAKVLRTNIRAVMLFVCVALTLSSLWLAMQWATTDPKSAYYLPVSRAFEFLLGVALSLIVSKVAAPLVLRQVMGVVGAGLVVYALLDPLPTDGYPSYWALIPCAGAFFMTWAGCGSPTLVTKFLSFRLFVGLGLLSYGWYLWHWPLLVMGESVNLAPPPLWMKVTLVLIALGIAYLSWRFIEGIFYNRSGGRPSGYTWGPRRVVLAGVSSMTTVAVLAAGSLVVADDQADSPHWEAVNQQLNDFPRLPEKCATEEEKIPQRAVLCRLNGQENDLGTVVLWGDSHAWMYVPALEAAAEDINVNLVLFSQGSCPPFDPEGMGINNCVRGNQLAVDFVDDLVERGRPLRVLLGASWEIYFGGERVINLMIARGGNPEHEQYVGAISKLFQKGGASLFDHLGELGVGVDVIAPVAEVPRNAPLCEAQIAHFYSCDILAAESEAADRVARNWLEDQMRKLAGNPRFIDVNDAFCDDGLCRARVGDVLTYFDNNHLSASFSSTLGDYFKPTLQAAADDAEALAAK
jgi:peptidoglycan/LPS O-acetylase OafA/YrhL